MRLIATLLIGVTVSLFSIAARAAQEAEIIEETAVVYDKPSSSAQEIDYLSQGSVIRISSEAKNGWYKIVIPGRNPTMFGWVASSAIRPRAIGGDLKTAGIQAYSEPATELPRHRFVFDLLAQADYLSPTAVQTLAALPNGAVLGVGFALQAGYRLATDWTLKVFFAPVAGSQTGSGGDYALGGTRYALMAEYTFVHELPFKVGIALGAGQAASLVATGHTGTPSFETTPVSVFWFPGELTFNWYPFTNFALALNAGFQYALTTTPSVVDLTSPFAQAGLQIEF